MKSVVTHGSDTSLPLRCAPSHALSASTAWWKSPHSQRGCSWAAAAADQRQVSHCEHRSCCTEVPAPVRRRCVMERPPRLSAALIAPLQKTWLDDWQLPTGVESVWFNTLQNERRSCNQFTLIDEKHVMHYNDLQTRKHKEKTSWLNQI